MKEVNKIQRGMKNPYDFANPVTDVGLFAGRRNELLDIEYYLNQGKLSSKPISLALIGERASGKTSFLNIIEIKAKKIGYCTVRVNLDESDGDFQFNFFFKIFDSVFNSILELNAFEGKEGKTYETYLDLVYSYKFPPSKLFCPFLFPHHYAKVLSEKNFNANISESAFRTDLATFYNVINKPIIILFDECNVLSQKRVLLEKLRNIFMNSTGYMLVITGTPDLFPLIDDIFSPIIRQFKKISIAGFPFPEDTYDCIDKPLVSINIDPSDVFDPITSKEIHSLSSGKPYEIQLICHFLFKQVQTGVRSRMTLDHSVLEMVRNELETSQDIAKRPILLEIKKTKSHQLSILNTLCFANSHASFEDVYNIEYICFEHNNFTESELKKELELFLSKNILTVQKDLIEFSGDEFDKIYTKYYARENKVDDFEISSPSIDFAIYKKLRKAFLPYWGPVVYYYFQHDNLFAFFDEFASPESDNSNINGNVDLAKEIYVFHLFSKKNIVGEIVKLNLEISNNSFSFYFHKTNDSPPSDSFVEAMKIRAENVGCKTNFSTKIFNPISTKVLIEHTISTNNQKFINTIIIFHLERAVFSYLLYRKPKSALFHAKLFYNYVFVHNCVCDLINKDFNNIGYLFLVNDLKEKARTCFNKSLETEMNGGYKAIRDFNVSVLNLRENNDLIEFKETILKIKKDLESLPETERTYGAVYYPEFEKDTSFQFAEDSNAPDLLDRINNILLKYPKIKKK